MKVLVLAAGRSNRMKPLSDKVFLSFCGKPLLQWQLEGLQNSGFQEFVIVGNRENIDKIQELKNTLKINATIVEQKDLDSGMCGAILAAKPHLSGDTLIFNSNDIVDQSAFSKIHDSYKSSDHDSYILGKKVDSYFPGGYLKTDGDLITGIVEKPGEGNEPSSLVNLVVHLHRNIEQFIEHLEKAKSDSDDLYEVAMDNMIKDGKKFQAVEYHDFWQPIKYPWHIHSVFEYLIAQSTPAIALSAQISPRASINGHVIIEENVKVMDGAVIQGPAYIGKNSIIANNTLVRQSHIGDDSVIGFGSEVARSYLSAEVWTHSNYIGDSIIGNNVSFGAGTVTGNLRLDDQEITVNISENKVSTGKKKLGIICGDNVRFGINTGIMPGVKIGSNSYIGAGITIAQDIPDNSFARGSWELKISENTKEIGRRQL
ncbi:hypothetical protein CVV38_01705 [Candidatus Peregrinibacteria bacterium HGW-Peregrinibacteria-1]|jgi:bifunctional UDP-N-acetylglucosamine pyrophosphorylase/glucosamine-1-phosphate N-acetyltransferase|nr:MAG: hypothetical protein CVV38_01705 [Candidatus Peregrinibacteria bacterium HGW-Peregrinibacteria-1]